MGSLHPATAIPNQGLQQFRRHIELANVLRLLGDATKGLRNQLARLHAGSRQSLNDPGIRLFHGLHDGAQSVGLGVSHGSTVLSLEVDKRFAPIFQCNV